MFEARIKNIQDNLSKHGIDGLLITSSYNISYLTGISAFSFEEREARLLITSQKAYLFTDARHSEMVKSQSSFVTLVQIGNANPFLKSLKEITTNEHIKDLGFEVEIITYSEVIDLEETLETNFIPVKEIVEDFRIIKDSSEIEKIKAACILSDKGFEFIKNQLKEDMTELDLKAQLENFIRNEGGEISFATIVAFGKNSAIPHHLSGKTVLQPGDTVLIDFGAKVDGYCSDTTRTIFFGEPTEELKNIYTTVKESQEMAIDSLRNHTGQDFELKQLHHLASSRIKSGSYPDLPHALGHGVGLQVHENPVVSPFSDEKIREGMVITIEPGIYIPGLGGVRIEDMVLITSDGIENLTHSKKELTVITI